MNSKTVSNVQKLQPVARKQKQMQKSLPFAMDAKAALPKVAAGLAAVVLLTASPAKASLDEQQVLNEVRYLRDELTRSLDAINQLTESNRQYQQRYLEMKAYNDQLLQLLSARIDTMAAQGVSVSSANVASAAPMDPAQVFQPSAEGSWFYKAVQLQQQGAFQQ